MALPPHNPGYVPEGRNSKDNPWYARNNHVRLPRSAYNKSEFISTTPISVAPGGTAPTRYEYFEGDRLDAHPDYAALTSLANWESSEGTITVARFEVDGVPQPASFIVSEFEVITLFVDDDNANFDPFVYVIDPSVFAPKAAPIITGVPTLSPTDPVVGTILVASPAPVTGNPTPTREWVFTASTSGELQRGPSNTLVTPNIVGETITVTQIETNSEGTANETSLPTDPISAAPVAPTVTASSVLVGREVTVTVDSVTGNPLPVPTISGNVSFSGPAGGPWTYTALSSFSDTLVTWTVTADNGVPPAATDSGSETVPADLVAPATLSNPTGVADGPNGATNLTVTTDLPSNGTLFWGIYLAAATPSVGDIKAGTGAIVSGSQPVSAGATQVVADQTGLSPSTSYRTHYVQENTSALDSNIATSASFTTEASAGWVPTDLGAKLLIWADLTDPSTLFTDAARTPGNEVVNGQRANGVTDKSGAGRHLVGNADGNLGPQYLAAAGACYFDRLEGIDNIPSELTTPVLDSAFDTFVNIFMLFKTDDTQYNFTVGSGGSIIGIVRVSSGQGPDNWPGSPEFWYDDVQMISPTRNDLYANWSTNVGVVASSRAIDMTQAFAGAESLTFLNTAGSISATTRADNLFCTHILVTTADLTPQELNDLLQWAASELPI